MSTITNSKTIKKTFWGAAAFYFLIAFEFFYMASPFAVYFYSVYRPVLNFFNKSPILAGLVSYFMPHFTETSSVFINMHNIVGAILAVFGFIAFCVGACQVYYHKLARKGAVTGGIYNFIRHPQYASFIICSFGLLLLWPRYMVLIMFVTMLFAYYFLARAEEKECEAKFGQTYIEYKSKTGMFLPFKLPLLKNFKMLPKSKHGKFLVCFGIYFLTIAVAMGIAVGVDKLTVNSLYAVYKDKSANISIASIESSKLEKIISIALQDDKVKVKIKGSGIQEDTRFLNYILPTEWYAAEIPMNGVKRNSGHSMPANYDRNSYKIILTKAVMRSNGNKEGKEIIRDISVRMPIAEVWVDVAEQKVTKILDMPDKIMYENIPVALY